MTHHQLPRRLGAGAILLAIAVVTITWVATALTTGTAVQAAKGDVVRVSVANDGSQSNGTSPTFVGGSTSISADGRFVAFESTATNLVPNDTNGAGDVFVRDTQLSTTTRVSVGPAGIEGNGTSFAPTISGNGRYVVFLSGASNLVVGDTNSIVDTFVYDRTLNITTRVSVDSAGIQQDQPNVADLLAISADGRYVAFASVATNLVAGDTNNEADVFVRDTQLNTTERVSVGSAGVQGNAASFYPSLSNDGRYVTFRSVASNLVAADTNAIDDVFMRDRTAGTTTLVSIANDNVTQGNNGSGDAFISALDGRYVVFVSSATNLVMGDTNGVSDIFLRDTVANTTTRISVGLGGAQPNGGSRFPVIGPEGRFIAYYSAANNLVPDDTNGYDLFVYDRSGATTTRASVTSTGAQTGGVTFFWPPGLSASGNFVVYSSEAADIVPNDTNARRDVFRYELGGGASQPVAPPPPATCDCGDIPPVTTATATATTTATATSSATATATATATSSATVTATATGTAAASTVGTITGGFRPPATGGYSIFVFGGGTVQQLVDAACPGQGATARFFFLAVPPDLLDPFVPLVPASTVATTNARFFAMFTGGIIPPGTPVIGVCR